MAQSHNPKSDRTADSRPARRRRWPRVVAGIALGLAALVVVLVLAAPYLLSTTTVKDMILSYANGMFHGEIHARDLNTSWGGPTRVQGLTVLDPKQREVLTVDQVIVRAGLWRLAKEPTAFDEIEVDAPSAILYVQEDGNISLAQAFEPREPRQEEPESKEPGKAPHIRGRVVIRSGSLRVVGPEGQTVAIPHIAGQATIDTLDSIDADFALQLEDGGQIEGKAQIRDLVNQAGQIDTDQATGTFAVQTPEPVNVAPLADFAAQKGTQGRVALDVQGELRDGRVQADYTARADQFAMGTQEAQQGRPVNLQLAGNIAAGADGIRNEAQITGDVVNLQTQLTYTPTDQPTEMAADRLLAHILAGEPLSLPDLAVAAQGQVDLAALAEAMPNLLRIREGVDVTGGTLQLADIHVQTSPRLAASGQIALTDLTAVSDGQPVRWDPIRMALDAHVEQGQGLAVERGRLESGFADADIVGSPQDLRGRFRADLTQLQNQLSQIVDLGSFRMAGQTSAQLRLARDGQDRLTGALSIDAQQLGYADDTRTLRIDQATVEAPDLEILLDGASVQRIGAKNLAANIDDQIVVNSTGSYDLARKQLRAETVVEQRNADYLRSKAQQLGIAALAQYSAEGRLDFLTDLDFGVQPAQIASSGNALVRSFAVDGEPVIDREVQLRWDSLRLIPDTGAMNLDSLVLEGAFAKLTATGFRYEPGDTPVVAGHVEGNADLAQSLGLAYRVMDKEPPAVAGQLRLAGDVRAQGGTIDATADGEIQDLRAGQGEEAFRDPRVTFAFNTQVDTQAESVTIQQAQLTSTPLSLQLAGGIQDYRTRRTLDITGSYKAAWDHVMALLHQLAPATQDRIDLAGVSESQFALIGALASAEGHSALAGLTTDRLAVNWNSGELLGLALGQGLLRPNLENGRLTLPTAEIPASGGMLRLGGALDFTTQPPTLRIPGQLTVLENIDLNGEIGRELLSFVNPLFTEAAGLEGKATLSLQDIELPLGQTAEAIGAGRGKLDLANVRLQPAGALGVLVRIATASSGAQRQGALGAVGEALRLPGLPGRQDRDQAEAPAEGEGRPADMYAITIGSPEFVIREGRLMYDDFAMQFPDGQQIIFRGSVAFTGEVDMYAGVPVTTGLLEELGVKGPIARYADLMSGTRIEVPVVGTRTAPRLDFSRVDIKPLLRNAIQNFVAREGTRRAMDILVPGSGIGADILQDILTPGQQSSGVLGPVEKAGEGVGEAVRDVLRLPGQQTEKEAAPAGEPQPEQKPAGPLQRIGEAVGGILGTTTQPADGQSPAVEPKASEPPAEQQREQPRRNVPRREAPRRR